MHHYGIPFTTVDLRFLKYAVVLVASSLDLLADCYPHPSKLLTADNHSKETHFEGSC